MMRGTPEQKTRTGWTMLVAIFVTAAGVLMPALLPHGSAHAWTFKSIHRFCRKTNCVDGSQPQQKLLLDASGNLYGTATRGAFGAGVVYMLSPKPTGWGYRVLYHFCPLTGCFDGSQPQQSWLVKDVAGNLYGTTVTGGRSNHGVVFRLSPNVDRRRWTYKVLYSFCNKWNCADGGSPSGGLSYVGAADGAPWDGVSPLYGVTSAGGKPGAGVAYSLAPEAGDKWPEKVIYAFCMQKRCADGQQPVSGLTADANGALFGATLGGGHSFQGVAYKLTFDSQLGAWTETVIHHFCTKPYCPDGGLPYSGLVLDNSGNLFGATYEGGQSPGVCLFPGTCGLIFKISSDGTTFSDLHDFCGVSGCSDGGRPMDIGGVLLDKDGNVYGTTTVCGANGYCPYTGGTVFRFRAGTFETIYDFCQEPRCKDGEHPVAGLIMDSSGNLFGSTDDGVNGAGADGPGTVFELSP